MKIVCATGNAHKVEEFQSLFDNTDLGEGIEVHSAKLLGGMPDVDENADSFLGNARLKAESLCVAASAKGAWVLADDSGLAVDYLHGAPGVYSARYAGLHATDSENVEKLLGALEGVELGQRQAKFVCALYLIDPNKRVYQAEGYCHGLIAHEVRGAEGFGYDPVFVPQGYESTFGELGSEIKDSMSHRAEAVASLIDQLRS
ncbi:MAG: RdgB/HAM1 family non-canonical purine NTP pyrophosphatase [Opitutales bacterium]